MDSQEYEISKPSNLVKLNVRGYHMEVSYQILEKMSYFASYLDRWNNDSKEIFIECDPILFSHVINIFTISGYTVPSEHIDNIRNLLNYFGPSIQIPDEIETIILNNNDKYIKKKVQTFNISFKGVSQVRFNSDASHCLIKFSSLTDEKFYNISLMNILKNEQKVKIEHDRYKWWIIDEKFNFLFEYSSYIVESYSGDYLALIVIARKMLENIGN